MYMKQLIWKTVHKFQGYMKQLLPGLMWVLLFCGLAGTAFGQGVFPTSYAENQVPASVNLISIDFEDVPMQEALSVLARSANVGLTYNSGLVPDKSVTRSFQNVHPVSAMMDILRDENLQVALASNGTALLIKPAPETMGQSAQQTGEITGRVTDATTGEELIGVHILVDNTAIGAATNHEGVYRLARVPEGDHILNIGYLGYVSKNIEVSISDGQVLERDIQLNPDVVEGDEITIYTQALGQARAVRQQLNSNTIVNVVSETRLRELPDANAAESIGRLPGVSLIRDGGEGQKVAIRGMGPQYSSITINGIRVPGTDEDRSVDLSMLSPEMLTGIEVYKSIRPDMDADAIGGAVNFQMGGAPDGTMFRSRIEGGYHNHIGEAGNYRASIGGSSRFLDNRLGVRVSGNAQQIDRSSHVLASGYQVQRGAREGELYAPVRVTTLDVRDRSSLRKRYGGSVMLDWELPNGRIFLNNVYSHQNRDETSLERLYQRSSNLQLRRVRMREVELATWNNSLAGEHDLNWMGIEWRMDRSVSLNEIPFNHLAEFREQSAMDLSGADLSGGPDILPEIARNRTDETVLNRIENQLRDQRQEDISLSLDLTFPVILSQIIAGEIKTGAKHYNTYRDQVTNNSVVENHHMPELTEYSGTDHPWQLSSGGRPLMNTFLDDSETYMILDGQYEIANMPSSQIIRDLYNSHSHRYIYEQVGPLNDYEARERITSGYAMSEINMGPRLMVMGGVRYEYEHSDFLAKLAPIGVDEQQIRHTATPPVLRDTTESRNMGMLFPMVHLRYHLTDWLDIRVARTESITRPSFDYLKPMYRVSFNGAWLRRGHTQIRPSRSTNYDAYVSLHSNTIGLLTVGAFYKDVENLIYVREARIVDPESKGLEDAVRLFDITEPVNNENETTVYGFEVEWQSNLTWLPQPFNGLVVNANFSRFFSESSYHSFLFQRTAQGFVGIDTFRVAPMVHQADYIANVSVGYDIRGFSSRISVQYQGPTLRSIGSRPERDEFTDEYLRLDATIRQRLATVQGARLSAFANLTNITNREDRSSQFTRDRPIALEYYGATFDIGFEVSF